MKYLSVLGRLDEGELVRAEDGGWLEELEVVHIVGLGVVHQGVWSSRRVVAGSARSKRVVC